MGRISSTWRSRKICLLPHWFCCHCTVKISLQRTVVSFTRCQVVGIYYGPKHVYILLFILITSNKANTVMPVRVKFRTDRSPSPGWVNKLILYSMVIAVSTFFPKPQKLLKWNLSRRSLWRSQQNPELQQEDWCSSFLQGSFTALHVLVHISLSLWFLHSRSSLLVYLLVTLPKYNNLHHVDFFMDVTSPGHQAKHEPIAHPMIPPEPSHPISGCVPGTLREQWQQMVPSMGTCGGSVVPAARLGIWAQSSAWHPSLLSADWSEAEILRFSPVLAFKTPQRPLQQDGFQRGRHWPGIVVHYVKSLLFSATINQAKFRRSLLGVSLLCDGVGFSLKFVLNWLFCLFVCS